MGKKNVFVEYVIKDVLNLLPDVTARPMFGGFGIYYKGKVFAIVFDDMLYFKVSELNKKAYVEAGSEPFVYQSKKGPMSTSYWRVPEDVMENPKLAEIWAQKSIAIQKKRPS